MSANTERIVLARGLPAWHNENSTVLPDDAMSYETIVKYVPQVAMPVTPRQAFYPDFEGKPHLIPDRVVNLRADGTYLGTVGNDYQAVQGSEAFGFLSELLRPNGDGLREVLADTAGTLDGGRKLFIACRASRKFYIAGQGSEEHDGFLTFLNSFDASTKVGCVISTVRTVCENTFNANLGKHQASYWFRHTTNVLDRLEEARQALSVAGRYWIEYERLMNEAVKAPFGQQQWAMLLDELTVPTSKLKDLEKSNPRAFGNATRERDELTMLWINAPDVQNVKGTAYAAVQAVTAFNDHMIRGRKTETSVAENRTRRILLDASLKSKAWSIIAEMAEIR